MIANNQRYIINIRDENTIMIKNTQSGETTRLFKVDQISDYIKNDIQGKFYMPDVVFDGELE